MSQKIMRDKTVRVNLKLPKFYTEEAELLIQLDPGFNNRTEVIRYALHTLFEETVFDEKWVEKRLKDHVEMLRRIL